MRSRLLLPLILLSALVLTGCGNNTACPPGDSPPCEDQVFAHINLLAGRLSDQLYTLDIAQMLLPKGATSRFMTTIDSHDSTYTRQEIYDAMQSAILVAEASDSISYLLGALGNLADSLDSADEWAPLYRQWRSSIEEALLVSDNLLQMLTTRAESIACKTALRDAPMDILSLRCMGNQIIPACDSLACLFEEADKLEISAFLPTMLSCTPAWWGNGWGIFVREMIKSCEIRVEPFLGPIGLYHLADDVLTSETGWATLEKWAVDPGSIRIDVSYLEHSGAALAVLVPDGDELRGSYYHPLLLSAPTDLSPIPAGRFRLLLFSPSLKPYASPPFYVEAGMTTEIQPAPVPIGDGNCSLDGGGVPLWVVDPRSDEHISNDFNVECRTEVWDGSTLFQLVFPVDTLVSYDVYLVRTCADFRFVVDCSDQTISGISRGGVSLVPYQGGECTSTTVEPDSVTIFIDGIRTLDGIHLFFTLDTLSYIASVECPGGAYSYDVSDRVFPYREASFTLGNAHSDTTTSFGTIESPVYFEMEIHRVF